MIKNELSTQEPVEQTVADIPVAQPTPSSERFEVLDVLRGFALLGVLLANMSSHSGYFFLSDTRQEALSTAAADSVVMWTLHFLVEGKFYSLFSLLFGIGFALQMRRSATVQSGFARRFRRRLFVLFIIGLLHAVLFYVGDILTVYAITGFFLLLFRSASNRTLLRSAGVLMLLPFIQYAIFWGIALAGPAAPPPPPADPAVPSFFDGLILRYQSGGFGTIVQNNVGGLLFGRYPDLLFTGRFFRVLAMFLVGFYATRRMIFASISENRRFLQKLLLWGAVIGIPANFVLAGLMETGAYYGMEPWGILQPFVYAFGVPALSLCYAAGICLVYNKNKDRSWLRLFSPVGKMALTNYLAQSVVCCILFMGYGFGLFARVGPAKLVLIALALYAAQVAFSHWWLGRFLFGPMEWLWRSATYGKWQPMRKRA
ncbi:MAG: DUF418 domain-containing protein [Chitinophagaceae bacterium]|nr:MAG: DUF418 domain-containing protein [Chitinophagaceae bacterium]